MATVDELNVQITADSSKLASEVGKAERKINSLTKSTEKSSKGLSTGMIAIGTAIGHILGKVVTGAFQAINAHMDDAIKRLDTLNNYTRVMSNLGISAQDSEKSLKVLDNGITGLPTRLDDAASAVQRFTAANGNIAASTDMFLALNNAILAGGASTETQTTALEQMMQAYSKGKPDAMEWRALLTAMPAQLKQIATSMGYTSSAMGGDLYTAIQKGQVSMNDFMFAIMKLNKEGVAGFDNFATQAKNATGGVGTSIANLKTAITRGITQIMDVIGQSNIASFFSGLSKAISTAFTYVAAFVKIIKEAVAWIGALFGGSGSTSGLVKETGGAATNVDNISSGAADTASGLNDATKAAKKLKGQLASFDEMNVLNKQDNSSGSDGSGGSSAGGGGTISDYTWDTSGMDDAANKVDELVERIKRKIGEIFDNAPAQAFLKSMRKILKTLQSNFSSVFGKIGSISSTLWNNMSKSLEKYGQELETSLANYITSAGNHFCSLINLAFAPIDGFLGGVEVRVAQSGQNLTDAIVVIGINAADSLSQILDSVTVGIEGITEPIRQGFQNLGEFFTQVLIDMTTSLAEHSPEIFEGFTTLTTNIISTVSGFGVLLAEIWEGITGTLKKVWDENGKELTDNIALAIDNILKVFQSLWDNLIEPIVRPMLETLKRVWEENLKPIVEKVAEFVTKLINFALVIWNQFVSPIIQWLAEKLAPTFEFIGGFISGIIGNVGAVIGSVVGGIIGVFSGIIDFLTGVFTGNWEKAWNGIKSIFQNIANALGGIIKAPINFIIDCINGFIRGLNKIKIPDWVPGVGGKGVNIGEIPRLAKGGIATSPTVALFGEAGREAVLPLDRNTGWMDELADKINSRGGTSTSAPQQLTIQIGDEKVFNKVIDYINEQSQLKNRCVINV